MVNRYLFYTSFTTLATVYSAIVRRKYVFAIGPTAVLLTSLNYYGRPFSEFRRKLDMYTVCTTAAYQTLTNLQNENFKAYACLALMCGLSYILSKWHLKKGNYLEGTLTHSLIHFFGNRANLILLESKDG